MALVGRGGSQDFVLTTRVRCGWKRERVRVVQEGQCKGLSLGSTQIAVKQYWQLELPFTWLFVCLFHSCHLAGPKRHHLPIVDMSQSHSECFGDPDDEALHHFCFPDVKREPQMVCTWYRKAQ